jgi:putative FmdB family regulatory protein
MPTYDYQCDSCGHKFELFQSIKDDPIRKCPECKKLKLRRLFGTGAALVFKGSGFYKTDYRSEAYKKAAQADSSSAGAKPAADGKAKDSAKTSSDGAASAGKSKKASSD